MAVDIGQEAPDFELIDQHREPVKLSQYRGKKRILLIFHPLSFTGICEGELCALRDEYGRFRDSNTEVIAVSVDSSAVHKAWADKLGIEYPYLADFWPHGEVARRYGVFDEERGLALRGTFVIDKQGSVTFKAVQGVPDGREVGQYLQIVESSEA